MIERSDSVNPQSAILNYKSLRQRQKRDEFTIAGFAYIYHLSCIPCRRSYDKGIVNHMGFVNHQR
ncbi:hypothetical protein D1AOALGA4SA_9658 [Olavius algarvensis Delta 1 endosymbiont]|nr:hypothetical protein D1AOALGA4SA_9658 [Olavius algarvensis Delta 1 endosymbiont]